MTVRFTKWGGGPHWTLDGLELGSDDAGAWVGLPKRALMSRPGHEVRLEYDRILVVAEDIGFVASFNEWIDSPRGARCATYVDITTTPVWGDGEVTMVDLDLDVVQEWTGWVSVQDRDEFADHRRQLAYPDELVEHAKHWCDEVRRMVRVGEPPFDGREAAWLDVLAELTTSTPTVAVG